MFLEKNSGRNGDEIDLHGLFVQEATDRAEEAIARCQREGKDHLTIIVGRGNHSVGKLLGYIFNY
jgi:DNA-nicking Smr family endonuclease